MKFKKFTNFIHLIISIIISIILSYVFLLQYIDIKSCYLFSNAIAIIIYIILTITYRKKVLKYKSVEATLKKCEYSFLSNCDLTYEFMLNGKLKEAKYEWSQFEKVGKTETIYISNDNKKLILKRDITLFKNKGLIIFGIIACVFLILGFYFYLGGNYSSDANEAFKYVFVFKFLNIFPIFSVVVFNIVIKKMKIKCTIVDGKVMDVDIIEHSRMEEVGGRNTVTTYDMGTPKYEYYYNGEKRIYVSNTSSTKIPNIGSIKKLYIDKDGIVVREKGEFRFLILFGIGLLIFYLIGITGIFSQ